MTKVENTINHLVDNLSTEENAINEEISHNQLGELHTFLCCRTTCRRGFKFYSDHLIYLTVKDKKEQYEFNHNLMVLLSSY
ncbi:unnamed protein product [Rotaria sp. Silwood1]|nr:unnamed protein product [Rotaria sp. Silwood1]CAF1218467.1 unnamed protein product [Rotaria sp. Silwood1]CAF1221720.1 unnamed protein product [Rotaria sp. Silwood1]CAF3510648.1 unnamed protein product [Rotaria sp. Silwood1]CAF3511369.1 unnamed protein product [Rotaria sp. Silwood1]